MGKSIEKFPPSLFQIKVDFRIQFSDGQKKYGVFPADPLHFEKILLDQSSGPVRVKVDFSETDLTGFKNLVIEGIRSATVPIFAVHF